MSRIKLESKIFLIMLFVSVQAFGQVRTRESFNKNWKFFLGDDSLARFSNYKDTKWRALTLPHDWSIEGAFDEKNPAKPEGGGLPTGIGWYRKTFVAPANFKHKQVVVEFDGVYKNSEVWVNGQFLGKRPYGYISFQYEISKYLKPGSNVIAVKVDNSAQPDSRWYSGSGIYRNVWLTVANKVAVAQWGVFVKPTVETLNGKKIAKVSTETTLSNVSGATSNLTLTHLVYDASGKLVWKSAAQKVKVEAKGAVIQSTFTLNNPVLWSTTSPKQYKLITQLSNGKEIVDRYTSKFGVRSFNFDAKTGFSLNDKSMKILGVCLHHDLGALGAAVNVRAMQRQLEILKEMGCNAIRMSHNPPAAELLDLCDEMGFLVMDEAFDMWAKKKNKQDYHLHFPEWHNRDLTELIKRDRNHPSIILWSIGNEIREQFDSTGVALTKELVRIVKDLDPTRPVLSALTELVPEKNFIYQANVLDMYALNYNHKFYKEFPTKYPGMKFIASETTSGLQTRGFYDTADTIRRWPRDGKTKFTEGNKEWSASSYDNVSAYWGSTHEETWKEAKKSRYMVILFRFFPGLFMRRSPVGRNVIIL